MVEKCFIRALVCVRRSRSGRRVALGVTVFVIVISATTPLHHTGRWPEAALARRRRRRGGGFFFSLVGRKLRLALLLQTSSNF